MKKNDNYRLEMLCRAYLNGIELNWYESEITTPVRDNGTFTRNIVCYWINVKDVFTLDEEIALQELCPIITIKQSFIDMLESSDQTSREIASLVIIEQIKNVLKRYIKK